MGRQRNMARNAEVIQRVATLDRNTANSVADSLKSSMKNADKFTHVSLREAAKIKQDSPGSILKTIMGSNRAVINEGMNTGNILQNINKSLEILQVGKIDSVNKDNKDEKLETFKKELAKQNNPDSLRVFAKRLVDLSLRTVEGSSANDKAQAEYLAQIAAEALLAVQEKDPKGIETVKLLIDSAVSREQKVEETVYRQKKTLNLLRFATAPIGFTSALLGAPMVMEVAGISFLTAVGAEAATAVTASVAGGFLGNRKYNKQAEAEAAEKSEAKQERDEEAAARKRAEEEAAKKSKTDPKGDNDPNPESMTEKERDEKLKKHIDKINELQHTAQEAFAAIPEEDFKKLQTLFNLGDEITAVDKKVLDELSSKYKSQLDKFGMAQQLIKQESMAFAALVTPLKTSDDLVNARLDKLPPEERQELSINLKFQELSEGKKITLEEIKARLDEIAPEETKPGDEDPAKKKKTDPVEDPNKRILEPKVQEAVDVAREKISGLNLPEAWMSNAIKDIGSADNLDEVETAINAWTNRARDFADEQEQLQRNSLFKLQREQDTHIYAFVR